MSAAFLAAWMMIVGVRFPDVGGVRKLRRAGDRDALIRVVAVLAELVGRCGADAREFL